MKILDDIGVAIPDIYLPRAGTDLHRWAVIACDQFTSEPDYWTRVEKEVGAAPSTLRLVFPEIYLEAPGKEQRIQAIQAAMRSYLELGLLQPREGMLYVERRIGNRTRRGLLLCLDLERYDYSKGSSSLIRATEGTILERLPPRMAIREGAALELPHILVLIDDPAQTVIEPVAAAAPSRERLYDFDLMFDSGHLSGFSLTPALQSGVIDALRRLAEKPAFRSRYQLQGESPVLLFAMGDGNHSLATAKAVWEKLKPNVGMDHPARFALVEIENVHDPALEFEPIHRVLFGTRNDVLADLLGFFGSGMSYRPVATPDEMVRAVDAARTTSQSVGLILGSAAEKFGVLEFTRPTSNLAVGTLQPFLDDFMRQSGAEKIDYVHGGDTVLRLGMQPGNAGFYLPRMSKSSLFKTVILDGALPRKTFSMGEAREKRFYMEARRIA